MSKGHLSFIHNNIGLIGNEYTPLIFKRIAAITGDDETPIGKFFIRQYQVNCLWPVINAMLKKNHRTFAFQMPRQSGKSSVVAQTGAQLAGIIPTLFPLAYPHLANGVRIGIYGPRHDKAQKLKDKMNYILSTEFYRDILGIRFDVRNGTTIKLSNGSSILCGTASEQAKCVEQPSLHLIITEETQALGRSRIIKSLRPMLASTSGVMVHIGTASNDPREHGFFYEIMKSYDDASRSGKMIKGVYKLTLKEVFSCPGTATYRKTVLKDLKEIGVHTPEMQSQYFGIWDFDVGKSWMREEWLKKCRNKYCLIPTLMTPSHFECVCGIDVAKVNDSTVVTILETPHFIGEGTGRRYQKPRVRAWLELNGDNYPVQAKMIRKFLAYFKGLNGGMVDTRGPGRALYDLLTYSDPDSKNRTPTYPFLESDEPPEQEIAREWDVLKAIIINQEIEYPAAEVRERFEFERQMLCLYKKKLTDGRIKIDHPTTDDGKKDYPDSLRLAIKASSEMFDLKELKLLEKEEGFAVTTDDIEFKMRE